MNTIEFNLKYPIGSEVAYWPPGQTDYILATTRSEAFDIQDQGPHVLLEFEPEPIPLAHLASALTPYTEAT